MSEILINMIELEMANELRVAEIQEKIREIEKLQETCAYCGGKEYNKHNECRGCGARNKYIADKRQEPQAEWNPAYISWPSR